MIAATMPSIFSFDFAFVTLIFPAGARKAANKRYIDKFVEVKVRMTPEHRTEVQQHAQDMEESTTAFINRAIDETMERDSKKKK